VQHNEYIFCISFILFFHPCHLHVIDYMLNIRLQGRKIAFSRPWFPSLGTENSIEYAKCPSPGTEKSQRNSLFSVLHGRKIAFSRPWFPSLGTENNINKFTKGRNVQLSNSPLRFNLSPIRFLTVHSVSFAVPVGLLCPDLPPLLSVVVISHTVRCCDHRILN